MAEPIASTSKNGPDHPPCWNPPSVSSSAPPGACTMPSRLMNSLITIRMQVGRCHGSKLIASPGQGEAVGSALEFPASLVDGHVMSTTQQGAVLEVRLTAPCPPHE